MSAPVHAADSTPNPPEAAEVLDFGLARLVKLEQRIGQSEEDGLRGRWEFGRELVAARDGAGRLPNGWLARIVEETGASRAEITNRARFAERFPTEDEWSNAVRQFKSWHAIVKSALPLPKDETERDPAPLVEGQFRVVCADPPWQYGNTSTRGSAEDHYPTMTVDAICDLHLGGRAVAEVAAPEAHCYLWTTNGFLREAFEVLDAWDFTYKTTLTWVKPQMGMGNYFRSSTEHILFGVRGGLKTQRKDVVNWFNAKRGKHSQKPGAFYELVETCSPGPYLELFARRTPLNPDWTVWGDEV